MMRCSKLTSCTLLHSVVRVYTTLYCGLTMHSAVAHLWCTVGGGLSLLHRASETGCHSVCCDLLLTVLYRVVSILHSVLYVFTAPPLHSGLMMPERCMISRTSCCVRFMTPAGAIAFELSVFVDGVGVSCNYITLSYLSLIHI